MKPATYPPKQPHPPAEKKKEKKDTQPCPVPLFPTGCPAGQVCAVTSPGHHQCIPQHPDGASCVTNFECTSGKHGKCRNDACPMTDTSIDCMPTQYCTSSPQGHMCVSKKENGARCAVSTHCRSGVCEHGVCVQDDCWRPFTQDRCQTSHYCSPGTKGHTCEMKRMLGASCRFDVQCKSHMCRHRMCMTDKCSVPLSTDRCDVTTEFCQAGPTGNMCVTKLMDMASCKVNVQCMSGRCVNGMCVPKTPGADDDYGNDNYNNGNDANNGHDANNGGNNDGNGYNNNDDGYNNNDDGYNNNDGRIRCH
ncbi:hypothetical protein FJT64_001118 [Amphibalanus amphitrite]|uniref:Uncharacterized protein n=1 Tax=Amphibalanus amphitrite TaxID=1232801 RepID=A0A6A4VDZ9_AMPAM|nr:hypothetical protein FJT64_001118 [Amphibalanus amphitrite]